MMDKKLVVALGAVLVGASAHCADVAFSKRFDDWVATEISDPMTDEKHCGAVYVKDKNIIYTDKDAVKIDFKGRGGVSVFRYRFGKARASHQESVQSYDYNVITVPVHLIEALDMPQLRVQGVTVLDTAINLDISLKGLKAARAAIAARCNMPDLPSVKDGTVDWAHWQVLPAQEP